MLPGAPAKHRLLLSLRSEAAMGLRAVRGGIGTRFDHEIDNETDKNTNTNTDSEIDELQEADEQPAAVRSRMIQPPVQMPPVQMPPVQPASAELFAATPAGETLLKPSMKSSMKSSTTIELPVLSTENKTAALAALNADEVSGCRKCRLGLTRTQTVFGEGDVDASIFFIGEGPGETEDLTGRPFVGRAGQLLDKMIGAMGLTRSQVFIANIVKCRPPDNRLPAPDEVATCTPYLVRQLEIVRPKVIVTLGLPAAKYMLEDPKLVMGRTRGVWQSWRGIKLMPTYHPSYVLRAYTEANRQAVWSDLQLVMKEIGLPIKNAAVK